MMMTVLSHYDLTWNKKRGCGKKKMGKAARVLVFFCNFAGLNEVLINN